MEERKKKRRRKKTSGWVGLMGLLIVCLIVLALSPVCAVKEVEILGNETVKIETIKEAIGPLEGRNIFRISLGKTQKKLENIPYIKEAEITRLLPDKLKISLTETENALFLSFSGKAVCIDMDGEVLEIISPDYAIGAPMVEGVTVKECTVGEKIKVEEEDAFRLALQYIGYFKEYEIFEKVTSLDVSDDSNISFTLNYKLRVEFGTDDQISYKMKYLKQVVAEVGEHSEGRINIRSVDHVTYREGPEPTEAPEVTEAPEETESPSESPEATE